MALLYQGIHIAIILSLSVIEAQILLQSRKVVISRNSHSTDNIYLPTYMCRQTTTNISHVCDRMKAIRWIQPSFCNCYCPYKRSTFYERDWTCKDNRKIREAEGCKYLFQHETLSHPLTTISETSANYVNISAFSQCRFFIWKTLRINKYLQCNGKWKCMTSGDVWYPFELSSISWSNHLSIKKRRGATRMMGRLVKLAVQCRANSFSPIKTSCILFKVLGTQTCPTSLTPSTVPNTSTLATFVPGKSSVLSYTPEKPSPIMNSAVTVLSPSSSLRLQSTCRTVTLPPLNGITLPKEATHLLSPSSSLTRLQSTRRTVTLPPLNGITLSKEATHLLPTRTFLSQSHMFPTLNSFPHLTSAYTSYQIQQSSSKSSSYGVQLGYITHTVIETSVTNKLSNKKLLIHGGKTNRVPFIIAGATLASVLVIAVVVVAAVIRRRQVLRANVASKKSGKLKVKETCLRQHEVTFSTLQKCENVYETVVGPNQDLPTAEHRLPRLASEDGLASSQRNQGFTSEDENYQTENILYEETGISRMTENPTYAPLTDNNAEIAEYSDRSYTLEDEDKKAGESNRDPSAFSDDRVENILYDRVNVSQMTDNPIFMPSLVNGPTPECAVANAVSDNPIYESVEDETIVSDNPIYEREEVVSD